MIKKIIYYLINNSMELSKEYTDHYKEYFYKISKDGEKIYYHRTPDGHKKIYKSKICEIFIPKINLFNEYADCDWLKHKKIIREKIQNTLDEMMRWEILYKDGKIKQKHYEKSIRIINERIRNYKQEIKMCDRMNKSSAEHRYKEETEKYGGFENYYKEKYNWYKSIKKEHKSRWEYQTLEEQGIIENINTSFKEVRRRYRRWLVKNHPDKGGNDELCRDVISEFKDFEESKL